MENHLHLLIRIRPDIAREWSDREVARRRVAILPNRRTRARNGWDPNGAPTEQEIAGVLASPRLLQRARRDLSSLGFFHRLLKEPCARAWNRQDGVTGHFWEGRFHSPRVLDEAALLRVSRYIELNEIRARAADSIPKSVWSSAHAQWRRLVSSVRGLLRNHPEDAASLLNTVAWKPVFPCSTGNHRASSSEPRSSPIARISLVDYVLQLDLLGRMRHPFKAGFISGRMRGIIDELDDITGPPKAGLRSAVGDLRDAMNQRLRTIVQLFDNDPRRFDRGRGTHRQRGSCYGDSISAAQEAIRRGSMRVNPIFIVE